MTANLMEGGSRGRERLASPVLRRDASGSLWCGLGDESRRVRVVCCFPWSEPWRYVSLRDDTGAELALIREAGDLEPRSRAAFEEALAEAGFLLQVTAVFAIDEEVEIRQWQVDTRQGPRRFQTRLEDWPRALPGGGFLVRDVSGDLYRIPEPDRLDPRSGALLWPFVD